MPIICLFGPDAAGKTTLAREVAAELASEGFRVKVAWMRGSHTFVSLLSRFLSRFPVFRGGFNPYYGVAIPRPMARLWLILEYLGALPIILWRFILPSVLGYTVVAERYVADLLVWIALITDDDGFLSDILARHLLVLASRACPAFLVIADPEELARRGGGELNVLRRQNCLYEAVRKGAYVVETTGKTPSESLREVLQILESRGWVECR